MVFHTSHQPHWWCNDGLMQWWFDYVWFSNQPMRVAFLEDEPPKKTWSSLMASEINAYRATIKATFQTRAKLKPRELGHGDIPSFDAPAASQSPHFWLSWALCHEEFKQLLGSLAVDWKQLVGDSGYLDVFGTNHRHQTSHKIIKMCECFTAEPCARKDHIGMAHGTKQAGP